MQSPPDVKAMIAAVFDRSADSYEQVGPEFFAPMGRELARRAALQPGEHVLDLGCGRGASLLPAAHAIGPEGTALGIDLAPTMVAHTAADAEKAGLRNVTVKAGDAAAPDVPPATFDVVMAGLVIFFLPDPAAALQNWRRALKPTGRLALTTFGPSDPTFDQAMKTLAGFLDQDAAATRRPAEAFRTPETVTEALTTNGFTHVHHEDVTFETRFTGPDQWFDWVWSHGGRAVLERLPEDRLPPARAAAFEVMEAARTPTGPLAIQTQVRYTTARPIPIRSASD